MKFLNTLRGEVIRDAPLAKLTSVRVGGAADVLVRPADAEDLRVLLAGARDASVPVSVLGGGANTIVADAGVEGVVVKLAGSTVEPAGDGEFLVSAAAPIATVTRLMKAHDLTGGEFLAGIPGTIGGATAMNAGTKHGEASRVIAAVELVTADEVRWVSRDELVWRYRHCELTAGAVVTRVKLRFTRGDVPASRAAIDQDLAYRRRTQPLDVPSSGSVFRNPPGDFAGRLIEAVGLKGTRIGGAEIPPIHANWIVNRGEAKAADVKALIDLARTQVRERFGVLLELEVKLLGRW